MSDLTDRLRAVTRNGYGDSGLGTVAADRIDHLEATLAGRTQSCPRCVEHAGTLARVRALAERRFHNFDGDDYVDRRQLLAILLDEGASDE